MRYETLYGIVARMARTMTLGGWLRKTREAAGYSLFDAVVELRQRLPEHYWISVSKLSRMELGSGVDPMIAITLANVYGVKAKDLPAELAADLEPLRAILTGRGASPWLLPIREAVPA